MSQLLITNYLKELANLRRISGTHRESVIREAFKDLLKHWGKSADLTFIPEYELETKARERRYVDGALLHALRVPFGYWEAKDERDDLDSEISTKFSRGYPKTNIIFEDSIHAVLIQHGTEVMRCAVQDAAALGSLLKLFFAYQRPEIEAFRKAVEQFTVDLPAVLGSLREMIDRAYKSTNAFQEAAAKFLVHAQEAINPYLREEDVREMLIQHILTGEVFAAVFPGTAYHDENSVARELHKLEATFFIGNTKHQTLRGLAPYYAAIRKAATEIGTHHEKQNYLKAVYENFYKVYNPKAADRLGVVYTPNEIVRFMIQGTDWLCEKHFGHGLIEKNVDILDPATGTGTFITELIDHFSGNQEKLARKYRHELHANEVAILPYYVANLNIEATYAAQTGIYEEFPGLCFVDTLDNTVALRKHKGHIDDLFGTMSDDNVKRIKTQNSKRISVIIGNPPYNANQLSENENNKNREYPEIDRRIKETYIAESTAQKTKLYDMYARFFRWATDRLDANGILAFISNRSFLESRTFDGFRATLANEFNEVRIVDLGGDVRLNPRLSGTMHNVFGIQIGVAISFMVRKERQKGFQLFYSRRPETELARDKLAFLSNSKLSEIETTEITRDKDHNWLNLTANDFSSLIPLVLGRKLSANESAKPKSIFRRYMLGVSTNRDEWVYDRRKETLESKVSRFLKIYNAHEPSATEFDPSIKWSETLKRRARAGAKESFNAALIVESAYRPFTARYLYRSPTLLDRPGIAASAIHTGSGTKQSEATDCIVITDPTAQKPWLICAVNTIPDLHYVGAAAGAFCFPRTLASSNGTTNNISDWAVSIFRKHYRGDALTPTKQISHDNIFNYVYGILHNPHYRETYAQNLKREVPHIPFLPNFLQWSNWGADLMRLHIDYRHALPYPLSREDSNPNTAYRGILKANTSEGSIMIDNRTTLKGVPDLAWEYQLGSRSAIDWVLDQHKEKAAKDEFTRDGFVPYVLKDNKEELISLLCKIVTVSVETVRTTRLMRTVTV